MSPRTFGIALLLVSSCSAAASELPNTSGPSGLATGKAGGKTERRSLADADRLWTAAAQHLREGRLAEAAKAMRESLPIMERELAPNDPRIPAARWMLAQTDLGLGEYTEGKRLLEQLVADSERVNGALDPRTLELRANVADALYASFQLEAANTVRERLIADLRKNHGELNRLVLVQELRLASQEVTSGEHESAEERLRELLERWERERGDAAPEVTVLRNELMQMHQRRCNDDAALALARGTLESLLKNAPNDPAISTLRVNLGAILKGRGEFKAAERELEQALALREQKFGDRHPLVANALVHLAFLSGRQGRHTDAEAYARRALDIRERAFGSEHPVVGKTLDAIGTLLLRDRNDAKSAEPYFRRAVELGERLDPEHPRVVPWLVNLAWAEEVLGRYGEAERHLQRALAMVQKTRGIGDEAFRFVLPSLARLYAVAGRKEDALAKRMELAELGERLIRRALGSGSELQRQSYMAQDWVVFETDRTLSFHLRKTSADERAAELALTTLLRRKGRALDANADILSKLRRQASKEDLQKLTELAEKRTAVAGVALGGGAGEGAPSRAALLERLEGEIDTLSRDLGKRYRSMSLEGQVVTLDLVRRALPPNSVLVEFATYRPADDRLEHLVERRWKEPEYVAYVLAPTGAIRFAELGPARSLDRLIGETRRHVIAGAPGAKGALRRLDERLMRPLRPLMGTARDVYLAPDGLLNIVPFAALVDEQGDHLVRRYRFTHLTSGRDLLREGEANRREGALVYAAPDYGKRQPVSKGDGGPLASVTFTPLPGTAEEGVVVSRLLGGAALRSAAEATESSLKAVRGPRVLHVATHGFFLAPGAVGGPNDTRAFELLATADDSTAAPRAPDPMLRSGLALANANRRVASPNDGVLTAAELADVDLLGTQLVVLSACDTGLGDAKSGDAVYGLRRALVLAGAETQVTSLWKVDDEATRALMTAYYQKLLADDGRSNALREVQLAMLGRKKTEHPYYWAPFIVSGNQKSLTGKLPPEPSHIPASAGAAP